MPITAVWSEESGVGSEQMTINVIAGTRQTGTPYRVMAFLYLPSLWSSEQVRQLQVGLARALGRGFAVAPADSTIDVITWTSVLAQARHAASGSGATKPRSG